MIPGRPPSVQNKEGYTRRAPPESSAIDEPANTSDVTTAVTTLRSSQEHSLKIANFGSASASNVSHDTSIIYRKLKCLTAALRRQWRVRGSTGADFLSPGGFGQFMLSVFPVAKRFTPASSPHSLISSPGSQTHPRGSHNATCHDTDLRSAPSSLLRKRGFGLVLAVLGAGSRAPRRAAARSW